MSDKARRRIWIATLSAAVILSALLMAGCEAQAGETLTEAVAHYVRYYCDKDGCDGEMLPTGVCYPTYPGQYPHVCDKCGARLTFRDTYPRIVWEEVKQDALQATTNLPRIGDADYVIIEVEGGE